MFGFIWIQTNHVAFDNKLRLFVYNVAIEIKVKYQLSELKWKNLYLFE